MKKKNITTLTQCEEKSAKMGNCKTESSFYSVFYSVLLEILYNVWIVKIYFTIMVR